LPVDELDAVLAKYEALSSAGRAVRGFAEEVRAAKKRFSQLPGWPADDALDERGKAFVMVFAFLIAERLIFADRTGELRDSWQKQPLTDILWSLSLDELQTVIRACGTLSEDPPDQRKHWLGVLASWLSEHAEGTKGGLMEWARAANGLDSSRTEPPRSLPI
jgi:hypothetical protein